MQLMNPSTMTGQIIQGRYKVLKDLKRGAFGKLYLAEDSQQSPDNRLCAIAILQPNSSDPLILQEARRRFEREVKILEKIGAHPQIPRLINYFEDNLKFYLVFEYIEGEDLSQEIAPGKRWSQGMVMAFLHMVLEVLGFVHQHQIVHRNLKPSNLIRRSSDRKLLLVDFGALKEIETLAVNSHGQVATAAIGTAGYIPIEQLSGKPRLNSDLYALGMCAIQALTGLPPRQLERDPKTGQALWHHLVMVDPQLGRILDKMICVDPEERYPDASAVLHDLRSLHQMGQTLDGRYQIVSLLGEGEFGKTFLAEDLQRAEQPWCAIVQLQPLRRDVFPWWEAKSFFDTEAQLLHQLGTHDRIPRLLADFEQDGAFYLVHELIDGEPISAEIAGRKRYDEAQAIALLKDVLETLTFVHDRHAIHGNLKPSNLIRRREDGKVMVTDFGSVKQLTTLAIDQGQLKTSSPIGTPGYMPKEQMMGNARANSDIYALGAIALQALTGVYPDHFGTHPQTGEINWRKHLQVSEGFGEILDKMVRSYFRERYQSAQEVLEDLQQLPVDPPPAQQTPELVSLAPVAPPVTPEDKPTSPPDPAPEPVGAVENPVENPGVEKPVEKVPYQSEVSQRIPQKLRVVKPWQMAVAVAIAGGSILGIGNYQHQRAQQAKAQEFIDRASEKVAAEEFEAAHNDCDKAIALAGDYAMAWKCRGDALYLLQDYDSALVAYENASKLEPKNPKYWNNRGEALYQLQRYQEAIAAHDRALELRSDDPNAHKGRGLSLLALQRDKEALAEFHRATELQPNNPELWERKVLVLEKLQRPQQADRAREQALAAYNERLASNPQNPGMWVERGRLLSELDRAPEAFDSYDRALEIDPEFYLAWNAKGGTLYGMREFYDALDAYDTALDIEPTFYKAWHNKGSVLSAGLARYWDAIAAYDRALEIEPNFYDGWRDRGIALIQLRRYQEALASFDKAVEIAPNDRKSWASRGVALNELRRYDEAIESFNNALEMDDRDAFAWTQLGIALESRERYEEALEAYNKALEIEPEYYLAEESRQWVLGKLGR